MKNITQIRLFIMVFVPAIVMGVGAASAQDISGPEVARKSQQAFHYAGKDMKARVVMKLITKSGKERTRELTMLRLDSGEKGDQKYYMYFHRPADVRNMTFMVWKYTGKDDDRWLYIPAIKLVKRIAADDKNSSFVGSDFSYEDISGRDLKDDTHTLKGEDSLDGKAVYMLESVPRDEKNSTYGRKVSRISKKSFLPLREEYYDKNGNLYKTFTAADIQDIGGKPTIMKRTMTNDQNGHRTEVTFTDVAYDVGVRDGIFSERYLRSAPREWIK